MTATNLHLYVMVAPLLSAFAVNLLGRRNRTWIGPIAVGALSFSTIGALLTMQRVWQHGAYRYTVGNWKPPYGIELVIDPLSALMLLLVSTVALIATVGALKSVEQELPGRDHLFFTLYLILVAGLLGLVMTGDAFNLYVLLEITSITTYGLIAMGRGRAPLASFNYIIMGSIGACFYLLGAGYLYILTGTLNMADIASILPGLQSHAAMATAFGFMIVGLWVKMAFFPLHNWLPNAYSLAPTGAGMMIAPLMTKVTVYLMIRIMFSVFSPEYTFFAHAGVQSGIVWVASLAILCASALALAQRNLRRMLTYILVAEVGYMVGGVWLANSTGMTGAVLHIVNDALMTLCLFLAAAAIIYRTGSLDFDRLTGLYRRMPLTMAAFTVGAFSMIGVPPTCGFFSKWYLILGAVEAGHWEFVAALLLSSLINAVLFFRIIEIAYFKPAPQPTSGGVLAGEAPLMLLKPLLLTAFALIVVGISSGPLVSQIIRLALPAGFAP
ncbi:NADH dehydrogenase [Syntrophotalea acetylenivorans]|uniref:NADH dehydrogenase n=1 Tax=Syntrophotalea acetylenivorans TaxID=1842532 RepID=A0A1L3GQN6_9BACT|nr:monovalent cation/H+ antiporter subunit D family protein [Syntrophotalea acetylenivorans]APG28237.1 NADH dehydrogenase [Syntrophotalea acetylenivorans]